MGDGEFAHFKCYEKANPNKLICPICGRESDKERWIKVTTWDGYKYEGCSRCLRPGAEQHREGSSIHGNPDLDRNEALFIQNYLQELGVISFAHS